MGSGAVRSSIFVGLIAFFLALAVHLATKFDRPQKGFIAPEAAAVAIEDFYSEFTDYLPVEDEDGAVYNSIPICLSSTFPLDFQYLNESFEDGKIVAFPFSQCSPAITNQTWVPGCQTIRTPSGEAAFGTIIQGRCWDKKTCEITVDWTFFGDTFKMAKRGGKWQVNQITNRISRNILCDDGGLTAE